MSDADVVVVGAGIGGLVAALELAAAGLRVVVVERAAAPGGKMREVVVGGRAQDAGPTVLTMRGVFDALFADVGDSLDAHLRLQPCPVLARHAWRDGSTLDLYADLGASADAIGRFAGAAAARGYLAFSRRAEDILGTLDEPFLRAPRPNPLSLAWRVGLRRLPALWRIAPFRTMWAELGRHFTDPRLRQLFGRYATYCGSSPFAAPATLMLVAHVERTGVWRVEGGMHRLARCLAERAAARGARFRWRAEVESIRVERGRVAGVRLANGEVLGAARVVFNGDPEALRGGLLGDAARRSLPARQGSQRSLSAWTGHCVARCEGLGLQHHNVYFSSDSRAEFDALFGARRMPPQPTVYVCAQDAPGAPPGAAQRLLCLVNAPADSDERSPSPMEVERCRRRTFEQLASCGLQLTPSDECWTTPAQFAALFPATGGALYGMASHGWTASFRRPTQRTRIPGLYLAGGATHPGPGVPMAALSGRLAAAALLADRRATSTSTFVPAATPGGTSTR